MTLEKLISDRFDQILKDKENVDDLKKRIRNLERQIERGRPEVEAEAEDGTPEDVRVRHANLKGRLNRIESGEEEVEFLLDIFPIIQKYEVVEASPAPPPSKSGGILDFIKIESKQNRGQLMREYLVDVEKMEHLEPRKRDEDAQQEWCDECRVAMLLVDRESTVVCPTCGRTETTFSDSVAMLSYDEQVTRDHSNYYAYKRINHFSEWLSSVQAKENTEIPDDVLDALRCEYRKIRVLKASQITTTKTREFLKKLKLTKYYEHVHYITNLLNNIPAPNIPPALEARLRQMFQQIQGPWERTKPKNRSNFFSYSFVLHKFCELLGADEYLRLFPLLKSSEKLYQQDQMWKAVCRELGWEFHASV